MKKIKLSLVLYILFVYNTYLQENWNELNLFGKIIIKPFWYIRVLYVTLYAIFLFPIVLFHRFTKTNKKWISFWSEFNEFVIKEFFKMGWLT